MAMLEWALERGCRAIMVCGGPVRTPTGWTSPADPMFDPLWARCAEAGVVVCVHAGAAGYNRHSGEYTGNYELRPFQDQTLDALLNRGRPVSDFFAAMIWQGAATRHREPSVPVGREPRRLGAAVGVAARPVRSDEHVG